MSDETENPERREPTAEQIQAAKDASDPRIDAHLQTIVSMVEKSVTVEDREIKHGFELGITLHVSGVVVTGVLVSHLRWAQVFGEKLGDGPMEDGWRNGLGLDDPQTVVDATRALEPWERLSIHLIEAQTLVGERMIPSSNPVPWRGRLAAVSGWSLGRLS